MTRLASRSVSVRSATAASSFALSALALAAARRVAGSSGLRRRASSRCQAASALKQLRVERKIDTPASDAIFSAAGLCCHPVTQLTMAGLPFFRLAALSLSWRVVSTAMLAIE